VRRDGSDRGGVVQTGIYAGRFEPHPTLGTPRPAVPDLAPSETFVLVCQSCEMAFGSAADGAAFFNVHLTSDARRERASLIS
jgi:hypothetical protein